MIRKTEQTGFRIYPDQREKLEKIITYLNRPMSEIFRDWIDEKYEALAPKIEAESANQPAGK